jgi:Na+/H+-dicarboxylate symporter
VRTGARLAALTFLLTWIPFTLVRGIAMGRQFRIGDQGQDAWSPLVDAVVQIAFVMLAPSLFAALLVFALWAWREERAAARSKRATAPR